MQSSYSLKRLAWLESVLLLLTAVNALQLVAEPPSVFAATNPADPKYVIAVDPDGTSDAPVTTANGRTYIMRDAAGKKYVCNLPDPKAAGSGGPLETRLKDDAFPGTSKTPHELLDSLAKKCFYRAEGKWTYEMCYKQHVRQIRMEGSEKKEEFTCGKYLGDEGQDMETKEDKSLSEITMKYVSHVMSDGDNCLLTGAKRSAEVRFTCWPQGGVERSGSGSGGLSDTVVLSVREFPTCNYVVVMSSPLLCKHPDFAPPPENTFLIDCRFEAEEPPPPEPAPPHETADSEATPELSEREDESWTGPEDGPASEAESQGTESVKEREESQGTEVVNAEAASQGPEFVDEWAELQRPEFINEWERPEDEGSGGVYKNWQSEEGAEDEEDSEADHSEL